MREKKWKNQNEKYDTTVKKKLIYLMALEFK